MDEISAHEASPLLPTRDSEPQARAPHPAPPWYQLRQPRHIALLTCLGIFLWVLSGTLAIVPATRLAEDIFCRLYYHREDDGDDIGEELCKVEEVQSRMAYLFGFVAMLDGVVGLLVAFPFGVLADRARKPVYILGTMGQSLNVATTLLVFYLWRLLPIELILVAPVFQLLGGGLMVATSVLYAMLADVLGPENR
jgi:PCFT/HCP family folate transporter-like MFS transporter 1/3